MTDLKAKMENFNSDDEFISPVAELYNQTQQLYKKFFSDKKFNITPAQWEALNQLWNKDGMSQAELSDRIMKDRPFTTRLVDDLEKKTMVYRKQDKKDRRSNKVFLTAKGRTLKFQILPEYFKLTESLLKGVSNKEMDQLTAICTKLSENIVNVNS